MYFMSQYENIRTDMTAFIYIPLFIIEVNFFHIQTISRKKLTIFLYSCLRVYKRENCLDINLLSSID